MLSPSFISSVLHYFRAFAAYDFACWPTTSTRLPIARLTSIKCRPQFARTFGAAPMSPTISSVRGSDGFPFTVTSRYPDALSFAAHFAVSRPGTLTHGVSIGRSGPTHGFGFVVPVMVRPSLERY